MKSRTVFLSLLVLFLFASITFAGGVIQLPQDTGQTKCYDSAGSEIACAGTGQDREIQAGVDQKALMKKISGLQIPFIENQGQIKDKSVRFYANTFAGTVFVTEKGEIVYSLIKKEDSKKKIQDSKLPPPLEKGGKGEFDPELKSLNSATKAVAIKETIECPEESRVEGINKSETKVNYFVGNKDNWRSNIQTWQEVSLGEVYDGIDLKLRAYGKNVEKLFTVHPKGSVDDIRLTLEGAKNLKVNKDGELEVETELGTIKFTKPVAYQEQIVPLPPTFRGEGKGEGGIINRQFIEVAYVINGNEYGFKTGEYDRTKELVIDPLLASTFLEGNSGGADSAYSIAIDHSGNVYVTGVTFSNDFPVTPGAYDISRDGGSDLFISKLNSSLTTLYASTYLGGTASDGMGIDSMEGQNSIAIDSFGNVYIAGYTTSWNFPTTVGAYDTAYNAGGSGVDAFISKLSSDLTTLISSTYLGGNNGDYGQSITLASSGNVYITGTTISPDFPTTSGAYDTSFFNNGDVFVSKLSSDLTTLIASTFLGGSNGERGISIAMDAYENVYVAGETLSFDFPTTPDAYDTVYNPGNGSFNSDFDPFVSKLSSDLKSLIASTFLGGNGRQQGTLIALNSTGDVYVTGFTYLLGHAFVYVLKLNSNLTTNFGTALLGGTGQNLPYSIAIDASGNVYIAGVTTSPDFATTPDAYDTTCGTDGNCNFKGVYYSDAFISKLSSDLTTLISSTYLGGSSNDSANSIAVNSSGNVYITGNTWCTNFPITPGAYDTSCNSSDAVFISKLDSNLSAVTLDNDHDGYTSDVDCNDNNPNINPGAIEICDGVDNDCDGQIDEGLPLTTYYRDADGDGYGNPAITTQACTQPSGYVTNNTDCNDSVGTVNPGATEGPAESATCTDGKDNNCNNLIDSADPNCQSLNADLIVSSWTAPANVCAGASISIKDITKNQGTGTAGASQTCFYFSTNTTLDAGDTKLGCRSIPSLGAGAISTGTTSVTLPNVSIGKYYIIVQADDTKVVAETSETNNKKSKVIYIGPDLIVSALTAPTSAVRGASISITDTTKNKGCGLAGASTTKFYLSTNTTINIGVDYELGTRPVPALGTNAISTGTTSVVIPAGIPTGKYYIIANADDGKVVAEGNETNNKKTKAITINP